MSERAFALLVIEPRSVAMENVVSRLVAARFGEWWHHLHGGYIVGAPAEDVFSWARQVLHPLDATMGMLVVPVAQGQVRGFLGEQAWRWLDAHGLESPRSSPGEGT